MEKAQISKSFYFTVSFCERGKPCTNLSLPHRETYQYEQAEMIPYLPTAKGLPLSLREVTVYRPEKVL